MRKTDDGKAGGSGGKIVLYAALLGNLAIAITKLVAAMITGSSSMLTEGFHSLVDTGNQILMLYGRHRAIQPPDDLHPLGYGRELYFWSFVVALLIFTGGAGASIYEGILHVKNPQMPGQPFINFAVLATAFVFESISLFFALREFIRKKRPEESWWKALRASKDPAIFVVMVEDSAALIGILVATAFIGLALVTGNPVWDGIGSIVIGSILAAVAVLLTVECKALLIGERADPELQQALHSLACEQSGVTWINEVLTIHLAPDQIIAMLSIDFEDDLELAQLKRIADQIEQRAKSEYPDIRRLFIRPQSRAAADSERMHLADPEL